MTRDLFREIAIAQVLRRICREKNIWEPEIGQQGTEAFIEKYLEGKSAVDEGEVSQNYEAYMTHAKETEDLYDSGRIQQAWSKALREIPNAGQFRIGWWDFTQHDGPGAADDTGFGGHGHDRDHDEAECRELQEPVGEALISAAFSALSNAETKITQLDIKSVATGNFTWADVGSLDHLDLTELQTLLFRPRVEEIGEYTQRSDRENKRIASRCGLALNELLVRCAQSVVHLEVLPGVPTSQILFPSDDAPSLTALRFIKTGARLKFKAFAALVAGASGLRHVEFDMNGAVRGSGVWRHIWRAIRHHPNRIQVDVDQIPCNDAAEITLHHNTGDDGREHEERTGDPWDDIDVTLPDYLSNKGKWDESCRVWFDDDGVVSEESEDEG